jgi:protein regulator of cytokinesis 1
MLIATYISGLVNPSELMASIDDQIAKAKEEHQSRKDIMEKINKWLLACDEEKWLEEHNLVCPNVTNRTCIFECTGY